MLELWHSGGWRHYCFPGWLTSANSCCGHPVWAHLLKALEECSAHTFRAERAFFFEGRGNVSSQGAAGRQRTFTNILQSLGWTFGLSERWRLQSSDHFCKQSYCCTGPWGTWRGKKRILQPWSNRFPPCLPPPTKKSLSPWAHVLMSSLLWIQLSCFHLFNSQNGEGDDYLSI